MAKLPDDTALGAAPSLNSGRPIATYDTSALAKGVQNLGRGMADLGEGVAAYQKSEDEYDLAKRLSQFETGRVQLDSSFDQDQDFGTRRARYEDGLEKLKAKTIEGASPRVTEHFTIKTDPLVARSVDRQKDVAFKQETDDLTAKTIDGGSKLIDATAGGNDNEARTRVMDTQAARIDALRDQGRITAVQALQMKQQFAHRFATTDFIYTSERDPEEALNLLRTPVGSADDKVNRILAIEGYDKNPKSSAIGAGQFINSTWLETIKKYRPDLAEGRSDADILAMRADKNLGREMTGRLAEQNDAFLKRQGIEVTPGATYLAHFLGPKAAAAVLQADPGKPVDAVLTAAVGEKMARQMVEANPTILMGRQAGSVVGWASGKMGSNERGQMYQSLPPEERAQMTAHALQVLHSRRTSDMSDFKGRVADGLAEAATTGNVTKPIGQWEFVARLGHDDGKKAYDAYQSDVQLGKDAASISEMSPEQTRNVVDSYTPRPGASGFADQEKRREILIKASQHVEKEKHDDPAKFAIGRLSAVRDARGARDLVLNDAHASPEDKQQAYRKYADTMLTEQARVGIPAENRHLLAKPEVDALMGRLKNPKEFGGTGNIAAMFENEAKLWGDDYWPDVYRQLAKTGEPLAIVLGSRVDPDIAKVVVDTAFTPLKEIANDQDDTRISQITKAVRIAFQPLSMTSLGKEGAQPMIDAFQHVGEKVAAYYVRQGKTADEAAAAAFKDLLGHKYEFVGSSGLFSTNWQAGDRYRIPKDVGIAPDAIQRGAEWAKANLDKYDLRPVLGAHGTGPEYRIRETLRSFGRDAVWTTAPKEQGLLLTYNDKGIAKNNGQPLILTWQELELLGRGRPPAGGAALYDVMGWR